MTKYLITYHDGKMPDGPAVMEQAKAAFGKWLQQIKNPAPPLS